MLLTETLLTLPQLPQLPPTWPRDIASGIFRPHGLTGDNSLIAERPVGVAGELQESITIIGPAQDLVNRSAFGLAAAAELMGYAALAENWDGEGAAAPRPDAIGEALDMLEATPADLGAPTPMVMASGDVALYWDYNDTYAEIGFDGTGEYYAFGTAPGASPVHLDDVPLIGEHGRCVFPEEIRGILASEPFAAAA